MTRKNKTYSILYCWSVISAIFILFMYKAFSSERSFGIFDDNEFFIGPVLAGIAKSFHEGVYPLRLDTFLGGLPLYNFTQLSPLYPFYFTWFNSFGGMYETSVTLGHISILHVGILYLCMFYMLRTLNLSISASLVGSTLLAFSPNTLSYASWPNVIATYAWFPLFFAGLFGVLSDNENKYNKLVLVCAFVLIAAASPSQSLIQLFFVTVIALAFYCFYALRGNVSLNQGTIKPLLRAVFSCMIAVILVIPFFLPAVLDFRDMIRWIGPFPAVSGNDRIPFDAFLIDQLTFNDLSGILVNNTHHLVGNPYIGFFTIVFVILAFFSIRKNWIIASLSFVFIYSLLSSFGDTFGFAYVNYAIPYLNKIREPTRFLFLTVFSSSILASYGIDYFKMRFLRKFNDYNWRKDFVSVFICMLPSLGLYLNVNWTPPLIASSIYVKDNYESLDKVFNYIEKLDPDRNFRVIFGGAIDKQRASMLGSYHNLRTLNAYFNPAPLEQFNQLYNHGPRSDNYLQILGAKYLICDKCSDAETSNYNFLASIDGYDIYQSSMALPFIYFSNKINGYYVDLNDFITKSYTNGLNGSILYLNSKNNGRFKFYDNSIVNSIDCQTKTLSRTVNEIKIETSCNHDGFLLLNEFYSDSWKAYINGTPTELYKINGNQFGVEINSGSSILSIQYQPLSLIVSLLLFAILLVIVLLWLVFIPSKYKATDK